MIAKTSKMIEILRHTERRRMPNGRLGAPRDIEFADLQWVARARSKDARRELKGILIADGVAVATDGARLHVAPCSAVAPSDGGVYAVVLSNSGRIALAKMECGTYPNWREVVPALDKTEIVERRVQRSGDALAEYMATHIDLARAGTIVHPDLWRDAAQHPYDNFAEIRRETGCGFSPVFLIGRKSADGTPERYAVVMPMKCEGL